MKLKDAVELFRKERGAPFNSYQWYRRAASRDGTVYFGRVVIPASKERGVWTIKDDDFVRAVASHRLELEKLRQMTEDLRMGIIHGKDGDTILIEGGGYQIRGGFRFQWSTYERVRKKSDGTWYCNSCKTIAKTEHNRNECHICSDWNGCGQDCTLSKVFCPNCGTSLET